MKKVVGIILTILLILNGLSFVISASENSECGCNNNDNFDNKNDFFKTMKNPIIVKNEDINENIDLPIIDTPDEFSWKDVDGKDFTTQAKDQGNCGSCWDFAAIGAFESIIEIEENNSELNPDLSEQYVLSCLPAAAHTYGEGCLGGTPYNAFYYIKDEGAEGNYHNGIIFESCFSYEASDDTPCSQKCAEWEEQLVPILDCGESYPGFDNPTNREIIKSRIYDYGPVAVGINVTNDFYNYWNNNNDPTDYYQYTEEPWAYMLNHIVVIVGWKDDPSIERGGYWICKNSWGQYWGYDGFFNIEYGGLFIGYYMSWVDYDPDSYTYPLTADSGGPYYGLVGEPIQLVGSASGGVPPYEFEWDFLGADVNLDDFPSNVTYNEVGTFNLTLIVTDNENNISTDTTLVEIEEPPFRPIRIKSVTGDNKALNIFLENVDYEVVNNITCTVEIEGGFFIYPRQNTIEFDSMNPGEISTISMNVFGIGLGLIFPMPEITISVECNDVYSDEDSVNAKVFITILSF